MLLHIRCYSDMQINRLIKKCLAIEISILTVILLIYTSLTVVIGYQITQSSNQKTITSKVNQKELLFQNAK